MHYGLYLLVNKMYKYISEKTLWTIYDIQASTFGGGVEPRSRESLDEIINIGKLESEREVNIFKTAAFYGSEIINKQPFFDNNINTAFVTMEHFLMQNGYRLNTQNLEIVDTMSKVIATDSASQILEEWLRNISVSSV